MLISASGDSVNQPMFVKDTTLLQDMVPWDLEHVARHHRSETCGPRSPARNALFGKPRFLTHDSEPPEEAEAHRNLPTSSPPYPPPQSSSPPPAEIELPLPIPTPPIFASLASMHVTPLCQPSRPIHDANTDIEAQVQPQNRIPSSTSPSPMKLPRSSLITDAFVASSPARPPDTDAITKALHESLTSLLGKRPIAEEDEGMDEGSGMKKGKRVRPGGQSNVCCLNCVLSHSY